MPVKNFLTKEQKTNLQNAIKESEDSLFRQRALMLLLMNDGKTYAQITEFIGCSYRSVAYWCCHGDPDNLESLKDQRSKGKKRKVTPQYVEILMETIEKEPSEYEYEFGRWTAARLSEHLEKETGIKLSSEQVRRVLKEKKYVYHWAKYSLEDKQNPEKREAFKDKLSGYIEASKQEPKKIQVWFWDESGFSMRVIRRKSWRKKGKKKKLTGQRRKGRVNVMGGLRYNDKKRICYFIEKGESETFYQKIRSLNEAVKEEWVAQGNQGSDFSSDGPRIIIILDNASL
jgi:transposase